MIFATDGRKFESYKERNLYYKFLAGYFFNELIQGESERMSWFLEQIAHSRHLGELGVEASPEFRFSYSDDICVSFDNHQIQHTNAAEDRGEFADILIASRSGEWLIGIEAKYLSDWKVEKDIQENQRRLMEMSEQWEIPVGRTAHVLLIRRSKWDNGIRKQNQKGSNIKKLIDLLASGETELLPVVMHWEDFVESGTAQDVGEPAIKYLQESLKSKG